MDDDGFNIYTTWKIMGDDAVVCRLVSIMPVSVSTCRKSHEISDSRYFRQSITTLDGDDVADDNGNDEYKMMMMVIERG